MPIEIFSPSVLQEIAVIRQGRLSGSFFRIPQYPTREDRTTTDGVFLSKLKPAEDASETLSALIRLGAKLLNGNTVPHIFFRED